MQINIKKISLEFVSGFVFCLLGYLIAVGITLFLIWINFDLGRMGTVLFAFFLGYPLGSILGIILVDKLYSKTKSWNRLGIGIAIVFSFMGGYLGFTMLKRGLGGYASVIVPLVITVFCLLGYNTSGLFVKKIK